MKYTVLGAVSDPESSGTLEWMILSTQKQY